MEAIQYVPVLAAALAGLAGIYLKLSESKDPRWQYALAAIIVLSASASLFLTYRKIEADRANAAYASATGLRWDKPVEAAFLAIGIEPPLTGDSEQPDLAEPPTAVAPRPDLIQSLFPPAADGEPIGRLVLSGIAFPARTFTVTSCAHEAIIDESEWNAPQKRYFSTDYLDEETMSAACAKGTRLAMRGGEPGAPTDTWLYDQVAGGEAHVIDLNTGDSIGKTLSFIEQDGSIGELTLFTRARNGAPLPELQAKLQAHLQSSLVFQLKFYQGLNRDSPLGEDCTSVHIIPVTAAYSSDGEALTLRLTAAGPGSFLKCEFNPI